MSQLCGLWICAPLSQARSWVWSHLAVVWELIDLGWPHHVSGAWLSGSWSDSSDWVTCPVSLNRLAQDGSYGSRKIPNESPGVVCCVAVKTWRSILIFSTILKEINRIFPHQYISSLLPSFGFSMFNGKVRNRCSLHICPPPRFQATKP